MGQCCTSEQLSSENTEKMEIDNQIQAKKANK